MENKMFCFQCEQTAGCTGCTGKAGVCGKSALTAKLQDQLTGALITLAKKNEINEVNTKVIIECLFTTITNVSFNDETLIQLIDKVHSLSGNTADYDMSNLWNENEDIRSLKSLILFGIRGMAAYAITLWSVTILYNDVNEFFYTSLSAIGSDLTQEELLPLVLKTGEINLKCMALLDKANTETFGNPEPTKVTLEIEKGPFIVITGHDLYDLKQLLEQTKDKGINIYTHW